MAIYDRIQKLYKRLCLVLWPWYIVAFIVAIWECMQAVGVVVVVFYRTNLTHVSINIY
jgi:hypothetical protein